MRGLWALLMVPMPALAQDVDCDAAETTMEMSYCAEVAFEEADAALNEVYAQAVDTASAYGPEQEGFLRDAQRAWIDFRDAACAAEGSLYMGGTMQPLVGTLCLERLTWARVDDLAMFVESAP